MAPARTRRLVGAVPVIALALALVACGGDDDAATTTTGSTTTTEAAEPITVLVSNDDGYAAEGIDVLASALAAIDGVEVVVVAPLEQRSGSGGTHTDGPVTTSDVELAGGEPATAVDGYPADTVRVAVDEMGIEPDLVVSGINEGQNIGPVIDLSGTVGAARAAVARGIPALSVSGGLAADFGQPDAKDVDYDAAVPFVVDWVEAHADAIRGGTAPVEVVNLNVPTCDAGEVRDLVEVPVGTSTEGALGPQDCTSELEDPDDDVTAFTNGFATLTVIPDEPANPPKAVEPGA